MTPKAASCGLLLSCSLALSSLFAHLCPAVNQESLATNHTGAGLLQSIFHDIFHGDLGLTIINSQRLPSFGGLLEENLATLLGPRREAGLEGLRTHVLTVRVSENIQLDLHALMNWSAHGSMIRQGMLGGGTYILVEARSHLECPQCSNYGNE